MALPSSLVQTASVCLLLLHVSAQTHPLTVADLWAVQRVGGPSLSPDGRQAVISLTSYNLDENSSTGDLWILDTQANAPRQLTQHSSREGDATWSPDGKWIAFTAQRDGDEAAQVYLISPTGGEARRLTQLATGVSALRWFPQSQRLAFISWVWPDLKTPEENARRLKERAAAKSKGVIIDDLGYRYWDHWLTDGRVAHVHAVDLASGTVTDLMAGSPWSLWRFDTSPGLSASFYDLAPDEQELAFVADSAAISGLNSNSDILTWNLRDQSVRNLTTNNPAADTNPCYSPDGRNLAWLRAEKPGFYADRNRITLRDRASGAVRTLAERWDYSPADLTWAPDSRRLWFTAEDQGRNPLWSLGVDEPTPMLAVEGGTVGGFALSDRGQTLAFVRSTLTEVPRVFAATTAGTEIRPLEAFNAKLTADWNLGSAITTNFPGWNNRPVQSWVVYPPNFNPALKWPLLQMVHGGPHGAWRDEFHFRWNPQVFAAQGYVVVGVNFHGSTGFGQDFVEASLKRYGEKEFADVEGATDALLKSGYIDPQRLTAAGGSFGGYMMAWLNGHTDRYQAHVCHALVYDWPAMMASDFPSTLNVVLGAFPWEDPQLLDQQSPLTYAKNFKTPTLVIHGELDYRVPVTQGFQYYNTLKVLGVPARLLYFPNQNHWILKPQDSKLWFEEFFAWLARYAPGGGR